jgi:hypothetical protein
MTLYIVQDRQFNVDHFDDDDTSLYLVIEKPQIAVQPTIIIRYSKINCVGRLSSLEKETVVTNHSKCLTNC